LSKEYGGKWRYDGIGTWECNDGTRYVNRTVGCDCDGECNHPPHYWLYGNSPIAERVSFM